LKGLIVGLERLQIEDPIFNLQEMRHHQNLSPLP